MAHPLSANIPDDWEFTQKLSQRIASEKRLTKSSYLRRLVERDLSNQPLDINPIAADVLIFLTRELLGKPKAARMAEATAGRDQVALLMQLLENFLHDYENEVTHLKVAMPNPGYSPEDLKSPADTIIQPPEKPHTAPPAASSGGAPIPPAAAPAGRRSKAKR